MRKCIISVIMPTFNREKFVGRAIESVLSQTYPHFELIIVDDGSTDQTSVIVNSFDDPRIHYIQLSHSGQPAHPRNKGIEASKGNLIAFYDSDDLWFTNKLERCLYYFEKKSELDMICSNEFLIFNHKESDKHSLLQKNQTDHILDFKTLFIEGNIVSTSTVILRKKCLEKIDGFDESMNYYAVEDYHLWLRVSMLYNILFISEPLGYCLFHEEGISADLEKSQINLYNVLTNILTFYPEQFIDIKKLSSQRINAVIWWIIKFYIKKLKFWKSVKWLFKLIMKR